MKIDNTDRRCLVTGGTRGIGLAIATALAQSGAEVLITGTSDEKPNDPRLTRFEYRGVNLSDDISLASFCSFLESGPPIDIIINNAGINIIQPFCELSDNNFELVQKVNIAGAMKVTKSALNQNSTGKLRHVVNIGSIWSVVTKEGRISYATSKAALIGFTRALAVDLAKSNIIVNAISPGFTDTELTRSSLRPEEIIKLSDDIPAGRMASVDEIAFVALCLTSLSNRYLLGQNIVVDGGVSVV